MKALRCTLVSIPMRNEKIQIHVHKCMDIKLTELRIEPRTNVFIIRSLIIEPSKIISTVHLAKTTTIFFQDSSLYLLQGRKRPYTQPSSPPRATWPPDVLQLNVRRCKLRLEEWSRTNLIFS